MFYQKSKLVCICGEDRLSDPEMKALFLTSKGVLRLKVQFIFLQTQCKVTFRWSVSRLGWVLSSIILSWIMNTKDEQLRQTLCGSLIRYYRYKLVYIETWGEKSALPEIILKAESHLVIRSILICFVPMHCFSIATSVNDEMCVLFFKHCAYQSDSYYILGLLDYGKNHNLDYLGQ